MRLHLIAGLLAFALAGPAVAGKYTISAGGVEMHCEALPTTSLTPDEARKFNVSPSAQRALLRVTITRRTPHGGAETLPAQVFAGAVNKDHYLYNIPLREFREGKKDVYYLGEFRITPPDSLQFLVNANVLGVPMKADFSRSFPEQRGAPVNPPR
jgi:Domain of unknown function (DUF4426)